MIVEKVPTAFDCFTSRDITTKAGAAGTMREPEPGAEYRWIVAQLAAQIAPGIFGLKMPKGLSGSRDTTPADVAQIACATAEEILIEMRLAKRR